MKYMVLLLTLLPLPIQASGSWGYSDFKTELASPYSQRTARHTLWIGGAVTLLAVVFEEQLDKSHDELVDHKPLGDFSIYGDMGGQLIPNAAYVLGQSVAAWAGNSKGRHRAIGMFKASAYAASVTTVLKYSIREPRPNEHSDRNSFPSGHTTTAFAFGGYVLMEHGWTWGLPAMGLATLTAVSRINDNRHRTHDVLAGATIGLAYAFGIAGLQGTGQLASYQFVPLLDGDLKGLAVTYSY